MKADDLVDIEQIKQLKARYFRLMDTRQWDAWGDVFTTGCEMDVESGGGVPETHLEGREAIVAYVSKVLGSATTTHHGHMPEIEITGPDDARGIWAMYDYVTWGREQDLKGYGHYHETYRRCDDGRWRIASVRLTRLRVDNRGDW